MFCAFPFDVLTIGPNSYFSCCPDWMDEKYIYHDKGYLEDPWNIWNSQEFQNLRQSVMKDKCHNCLKVPSYEHKPDHQIIMQRGPLRINLGNDFACNLHCWSCRSAPRPSDASEYRSSVMWHILDTFADMASSISVSANGDPFVSPMHLDLLQRWPYQTDVELFTNGLLLPRYWDSLACNVRWICLSVDATTKKTYEQLRRGAKWEQLLETLQFIRDLPDIEVQYNMAIQRRNIAEVHDFVRMMEGYGASKIMFTLLREWPHMNHDDFLAASVVHGDTTAFLALLRDPILQHPLVDYTFGEEVITRLDR